MEEKKYRIQKILMQRADHNPKRYFVLKKHMSCETGLSMRQILYIENETWNDNRETPVSSLIEIAQYLQIELKDIFNPMPQKLETSLTPA